MVGLAMVVFGLVPRAGALVWAVLAGCFVVGFFGQLLSVPGWLQDLSPFQHVPRLPSASFSPAPLLALGAVAVALIGLGDLGFRRRDVDA